MMIYVKSMLVGLGAAVLSQILLAAAAIVIARRDFPDQASNVGVSGSSALIVGIVMFAAGFVLMFRSSSRKSPPL